MKPLVLALSFFSAIALDAIPDTCANEWTTDLDKVYADESHCLTAPEIRSDKDNPISCFCRDAIADARYVYFTYLLSEKDRNLTGPYLALEERAREMCGKPFDLSKATMTKYWKWTGPEVVRSYPPEDLIRQIRPDNQGMVSYSFTVSLIERDSLGRVTKTESFSAVETVPASLRKPDPSQAGPRRKARSK